MSLYPSWQPGYRVSCDFGSGSDCLSHPPAPPPRLVLTLMSESLRAPLVSSCVAKAIPRESKGQEGERRGWGVEEPSREAPLASPCFFVTTVKADAAGERKREASSTPVSLKGNRHSGKHNTENGNTRFLLVLIIPTSFFQSISASINSTLWWQIDDKPKL